MSDLDTRVWCECGDEVTSPSWPDGDPVLCWVCTAEHKRRIEDAERQRDAEAENARLAQDRVQRLTEGNLRLVGLLREITQGWQVLSILTDDQRARLDAALGGQP